ncbi:MAG TPA: PQQ-binding-like beta-propeller repeat protein [Acidimicrobiia bacterium]
MIGGITWAKVAVLVATCAVIVGNAQPIVAAPHVDRSDACAWPMWGRELARTFATACAGLSPADAPDLRRIWFFNTHDVVTATPAVVDGSVYVGDWSGRFYALRARDGTRRWVRRTKRHRHVYAGQIVSSAAVATVRGVPTVYFGGGKTLYALRARDGSTRWKVELRPEGGPDDPTEIESSPAVADGVVVVGWDVHNSPAGEPAGVFALDAATGRERWRTVLAPTEGDGATGSGCADVWSSPAIDEARRLVFVGTGNCVTSPRGYGRFAEAVVALSLDDGSVRWSYQPHQPNRDDLDFAGAPNLFESNGRAVVGLGGKDGTYYALDRETGDLVWATPVVEPGLVHPGSNFSTGGFIGPTAVANGIITGGTAIGDAPYLHALDAATGAVRWQQPIAAPTYGAPAVGGHVVVIGGTDFTLRALDLETGDVLWSDEVSGAVSGGPAVVGDDLFAVAGIREPGLSQRSRTSGVYRYSLRGKPVTSTTTRARERTQRSTPTAPATPQPCVGTPCDVPFDLVPPPPGTSPRMQLLVQLDPWHVEVTTEGLGDPAAWLRPGSISAQSGATRYGVFISERDDNPQGGQLCVLDADGSCSTSSIPKSGVTYNRITILAITDSNELPSPTEGVNRLVVTKSFDPPLAPVGGHAQNGGTP